jgi:hypothetical protein
LASSNNPTFARITFCSVVIVLVLLPGPEDSNRLVRLSLGFYS